MQRLVWLLILLMVLPVLPTGSAVDGRSTVVTLELPRHDWVSDEVVEIDLRLRNAPFNQALRADWTLRDEQGFHSSGNVSFSASGTFTVVDLNFSAIYRGHHFHELSVTVYDAAGAVLGLAEVEFVMFRQVMHVSAGSLLAFGDSLSDMGNAKASLLNTPDEPPYWQGRFSNGEVWLGGLYDAYGLTSSIGSGLATSGANRAFGGAQTGSGYAYLVIPNVGTQITSYLANVQSTIPSNAVVSLWAGGNDFLYGSANADTIATNMEAHIRQLAGAGARTLIVPNLPPLEDTPEIQSRSTSQQNTIRNEVIDYNNQLATLLVNLRAELGITIHTIDAWTIFGDITSNKQALGLTNVQDAACTGGTTLLPLPICNGGSTVATNVDEYVFFDKAHPTRVMHDVIARFAVEAVGTADTDGDGVVDASDQCAWTPVTEQANAQGCAWSQLDDDNDGVLNGEDDCPLTSSGQSVDENGCAASQRDTDGDGVSDLIDPCPYSPNLFDHDQDGCADVEDADDDNDGVHDEQDGCPQGLLGPHQADLDGDGCADAEDLDIDGDELSNADEAEKGTDERDEDTDGDTWLDGLDAFPLDSREWKDTDRDGCGDNSDVFPFNSEECYDADEDGVGDNSDAFPFDENESTDIDGDGVGDNGDACHLEYGLSLHPPGCPDRDGDGYANTNDAFPSDPMEWLDTDGDGVGDNADLFPDDASDWADRDNDGYGDHRDAFPFDSEEWNDTDGEGVGDNADRFPEDPDEWNDTDDDGCGDNGDVFPMDPSECLDSDFDGIGDNNDAFPNDARETKDSDGDGFGDNSDAFPNDPGAKYDTDGDGVANAYDAFPNSASFSSWMGALMWGVALLLIASGGAVVYQRRRLTNADAFHELAQSSMIDASFNRPTVAPEFGAFAPPTPVAEPTTSAYNHLQGDALVAAPEVPQEGVHPQQQSVAGLDQPNPPVSAPAAPNLATVEQRLVSEEHTPNHPEHVAASDEDWGSLDAAWGN